MRRVSIKLEKSYNNNIITLRKIINHFSRRYLVSKTVSEKEYGYSSKSKKKYFKSLIKLTNILNTYFLIYLNK